ncbi:hypothetical protein, partial [Phocaeicola coprocola]|uniref:hypothetical protein n=1 Tax=Phocaeicola coprocola TaxID=310298 RepID=UPI003FD6CB7D
MKLITSFYPCTVRFKQQMIVRTFYALLTFIFICANATAQVSERISFDKKSKKITITLINDYDTHSSIKSGISYAKISKKKTKKSGGGVGRGRG